MGVPFECFPTPSISFHTSFTGIPYYEPHSIFRYFPLRINNAEEHYKPTAKFPQANRVIQKRYLLQNL